MIFLIFSILKLKHNFSSFIFDRFLRGTRKKKRILQAFHIFYRIAKLSIVIVDHCFEISGTRLEPFANNRVYIKIQFDELFPDTQTNVMFQIKGHSFESLIDVLNLRAHSYIF
jgi:hypothetical protein